jgi:hypothetical protein
MSTARSLAVLFAALVGIAGAPVLAVGGVHSHESYPAKLRLDSGKKWATDEPLRRGMSAIRAAMAERIEAIHRNKMTADQYRALGATVDQEIARIVAECKLEPKADAMLHLVIADLMAGAEGMQGKAKTKLKPAAGAHRVVQALNAYGKYFDHPGWEALK